MRFPSTGDNADAACALRMVIKWYEYYSRVTIPTQEISDIMFDMPKKAVVEQVKQYRYRIDDLRQCGGGRGEIMSTRSRGSGGKN